ncbi:hypothetical protein FQA39_LY03766 [Lamprigera yunnana]|nr:hypothetical protein FQA39_LY03766 [Lamprigera yunnana]
MQSKLNAANSNCEIGQLLIFEHLFLLMTQCHELGLSEATVHVITSLESVNLGIFGELLVTLMLIMTFDTMWKPRQIGSKTLTFEMIEEKKILKIEDMSGNEVYLGWESVSEVWSLESVLRYRLSYSSCSNFKYFYEDVIRAVAEMSGDVKINIYNIINRLSEKSDDVCCMLEVLLFMPEKALFDVQLERRIQEQEIQFIKKMWMLYAQEHWTKSYDLKSAVERLYEELGALEFDADHEAIYGMERYYTVQQCEELRDKYKIGRKIKKCMSVLPTIQPGYDEFGLSRVKLLGFGEVD